MAGTPSLSKAWALCFPFTRPGSFPLTPHPSLPPPSWEAVTGVWGRGRGCDELGQLAPPVLWLRWGARKLGRHICRVPSPGSPALAVWHPGCPTGRDRKLPPSLGSLPWHRPDLFSPRSSCRCLLGKRAGSSAVGQGPQPESPSHTLSPNSGPCLSLLPHPYPRKRRSRSWRLTWMNSWTWRAMIPELPGSR